MGKAIAKIYARAAEKDGYDIEKSPGKYKDDAKKELKTMKQSKEEKKAGK